MTAPRFLALLGRAAHDRINETADTCAGLAKAPFPADDLSIWTSREQISLGEHGLIIGHLFSRTVPSQRVTSLDGREIARILATGGASLFQDFWGGYVAFLRARRDAWAVLRDPSGTLPAYWRRMPDGGIALAPEMGEYPFRHRDGLNVDLTALVVHIADPHHAGVRTCIDGVSELLPGTCMTVTATDVSCRELWSPWQFTPSRRVDVRLDPADLRQTVRDSVRSWAGCFGSILLGLSGGLDSSIVASALRETGTDVQGLTMVWPDPEGDEREYARIIAEACAFPLAENAYQSVDVDVMRPAVSHSVRPFLAHYVHSIVAARLRIADRRAIGAFFTGDGGDNVFCLMRSVTPIIDRLWTGAGPRAVLATVRDVARLTGADGPTLLRHVLRRLTPGNRTTAPVQDSSFLEPVRLRQALQDVRAHPWLLPPPGHRPGAQAHVRMIRRAYGNDGFHSRRTHGPSISPLLAQPVVEMCLRTATWDWVAGGTERALARAAFANELPSPIVNRRTKGGPAGFVDRLYRDNEADVLEALRDGLLARSGCLCGVPEVSDGIRPTSQPSHPRRLLALLAAQTWAEHWMAG